MGTRRRMYDHNGSLYEITLNIFEMDKYEKEGKKYDEIKTEDKFLSFLMRLYTELEINNDPVDLIGDVHDQAMIYQLRSEIHKAGIW